MTAFERVKAALMLFPHLPFAQVDKLARVSGGYASKLHRKLHGTKPDPVKSAAGRAGNEARRRKTADRPQNSTRTWNPP